MEGHPAMVEHSPESGPFPGLKPSSEVEIVFVFLAFDKTYF
jgi:hypothetical protein